MALVKAISFKQSDEEVYNFLKEQQEPSAFVVGLIRQKMNGEDINIDTIRQTLHEVLVEHGI